MSHNNGSGFQSGEGEQTGDVDQGFGQLFAGAGEGGDGSGVHHARAASAAPMGGTGTFHGRSESGGSGRGPQGVGARGSPNLGLQRKSGRKRVIGGGRAVKSAGEGVKKSYSVVGGIQFNDVEELRGDAISRVFAQEILERLWEQWGLDTAVGEVMRKAEDVVHALFALRTASPDADYSVFVLLGDREVNLQDLSDLLASEEVTRRRFARAIADDIRQYISDPENVRLREMLTTELGVKSEYAHLAFDGSTHCSGLSANQVMFTKQLERTNLFDTQEVRDRLSSNQMLTTGQFQVNRGRGAYT